MNYDEILTPEMSTEEWSAFNEHHCLTLEAARFVSGEVLESPKGVDYDYYLLLEHEEGFKWEIRVTDPHMGPFSPDYFFLVTAWDKIEGMLKKNLAPREDGVFEFNFEGPELQLLPVAGTPALV